MVASLLSTKLYIPLPCGTLVKRPRLCTKLDEILHQGCKLILISAPAGFGKTTLLSEWIHSNVKDRERPANQRIAWLALDRGDNELRRFEDYLTLALQTIHNQDQEETNLPADLQFGGKMLLALQSLDVQGGRATRTTESILPTIVNEIATFPYPLILILDNFQAITSSSIHEALAFLLDYLPANMQLVISTRIDPALPLARLRAYGQMAELRSSDLRFTQEEAVRFLNGVMNLRLADDEIALLETRTEGWIAGLQMAALALNSLKTIQPFSSSRQTGYQKLEFAGRIASFVEGFAGNDRNVLDYLAQEVLLAQPVEIQEFLTQTSCLEQFSAPLCQAVTDQADSRQKLNYLEQANLFLCPLDNERHWYRYHHLFGDFLRQRQQEKDPEAERRVHRSAAAWYEQNGLIPEAVEQLFTIQAWEEALRLIEQHAPAAFARGEMSLLLEWLDMLPDELVQAQPWLCIYHAWALHICGHSESVEPRLQAAERALETNLNTEIKSNKSGEQALSEKHLNGHIAALRSFEAMTRENIAPARVLAIQALEKLPDLDIARAFSAISLGWSYRMEGDLEAANRAFTEGRRVSLATDFTYTAVAATCRIAYDHILQGRLHQATEISQDALRLATGEDGKLSAVAGYALIYLGMVYSEWNDLESAEQFLLKGIELCKRVGYVGDLAIGYSALVRVRRAQDNSEGASFALEEARRLLQLPMPDPLTIHWIEDCQVRYWIAQDDLENVTRWVQACEMSIQDSLGFQRELGHIALARALIAIGSRRPENPWLSDAIYLLNRLHAAAEKMGWVGKEIEILVLLSLACYWRKEINQALAYLKKALELGMPEGYTRIFLDEGPAMVELLRQAATRGIAPQYAGNLYRQKAINHTGGKKDAETSTQPLVDPLSERELEVLQLLPGDLTGLEIAGQLFIARSTLRSHLKSIYSKLNVASRRAAIRRGRELGLI